MGMEYDDYLRGSGRAIIVNLPRKSNFDAKQYLLAPALCEELANNFADRLTASKESYWKLRLPTNE
jgi:hypothetical protein